MNGFTTSSALIFLTLPLIVSCHSAKEVFNGQPTSEAIEIIKQFDGQEQVLEVAVFKSGFTTTFFEFPNGKWLQLIATQENEEAAKIDSIILYEGAAVVDLISKTKLDGQRVVKINLSDFSKQPRTGFR